MNAESAGLTPLDAYVAAARAACPEVGLGDDEFAGWLAVAPAARPKRSRSFIAATGR
jgi:hypothetical protein